MHALTASYCKLDLLTPSFDVTTVQAPQSPEAQPSFVPVRYNSSLKYSNKEMLGFIFSRVISLSFSKNLIIS